MRRALLILGAISLIVAATGCPDDSTIVQPISIDRPGDLTFVCFDTENGTYRELDDCASTNDEDIASGRSLTALVTQVARGEIAAIDLTESEIIDTEVRVPGFTFFPVGESPLGIAVSEEDPALSFVANYGSRTIEAVPIDEMRPDAEDSDEEGAVVELSAGPTDVALATDDQFLYATLPESGLLVEIPVATDGEGLTVLGEPLEIPLSAEVPDMVSPAEPSSSDIKICPSDRTLSPIAMSTRVARSLGATPTPVAMEIDRERDRLYIADAALPLIHIVDLAEEGATVGTPIATGSPVQALAITPAVPEFLDESTEGTAQFIYAIDAVDQSVMVIDISDHASPTYGSIVPVSGDPDLPDRLVFPGRARSIEVMNPGFPGDACDVDENGEEANAGRLRGVFVAVGMLNGSVIIVDVHDLDAVCRGGEGCEDPPNLADTTIYIRRHRPRIGNEIVADIGVRGSVTFSFDGATGRVTADGTSPSLAPALVAENNCPSTMAQAFPPADEGAALICTNADPWVAINERWEATWEGVIPGTPGDVGLVDEDDDVFLTNRSSLCGLGVLGSDDVPEGDDVLADYAGDQLVITASPPENAPEECLEDELFGLQRNGLLPFVAFAITRAHPGSLELGAATGERSLDEVRHCFSQLISYEIRTREIYTVVGSETGFLHRVHADDDACAVDSTLAVENNGRAFPGETYDNGRVRFTVDEFDDAIPDDVDGTILSFEIGNVPPSFGTALSVRQNAVFPVIPVGIHFSPTDQRLYVVDVSTLGIVQLDAETLQLLTQFD